ncbi:hypothetical protein F7725_017716 [Dissostichus mawsoni]|uniref:Uncharacterized protein n=1 Tax=Dissostichus mawsoni TaxID=36200 RepID=A0A7J5XQY8_DISMA|nr:hypothetical protein F7725_017716 [Dissostichus mawsoni]
MRTKSPDRQQNKRMDILNHFGNNSPPSKSNVDVGGISAGISRKRDQSRQEERQEGGTTSHSYDLSGSELRRIYNSPVFHGGASEEAPGRTVCADRAHQPLWSQVRTLLHTPHYRQQMGYLIQGNPLLTSRAGDGVY